jgi:UDP-N-acetylmuramoyl-tripeptide--D-alanyl-D-alanine ligase
VFELRQAFNALSTAQLFGNGQTPVRAISTDSRKIVAGDLFFALRGDQFDANEFAPQASQQGAAAVVVERIASGLQPPFILVKDGRRALGELALAWRRRFDLPVIAVTGSNGKTTVKEMIAAVLQEQFGAQNSCATQGNLNNDVGVPLSVFKLASTHKAAVLELGMNHPGEIAWIASIAQASVALVNNAQREHQEFMPSVAATAIENGAAIEALPASGVAVFPGDDEHAEIWRTQAGARRRIEFGFGSGSGFSVWAEPDADPVSFQLHLGQQSIELRLQIAGSHNVRNALAAAACCHAIGTPIDIIAAGLAKFEPVKGRLVSHRLNNGATLIDDSYNANPDSVRAAIDVLAGRPASRVLVLGDMGEVGDQGAQFHDEVGAYARTRGIEHLLGLGDATRNAVASFGQSGEHFADITSLSARARMLANQQASILVKGSRFMKMERVVAALLAGAH